MNKSNKYYNTKSAQGIKDLDNSKREVAIYLSTFDAMDSDNDVIKKGAFKKSITDRGPGSESNRKIAFLRFHDWTKPIGTFKSLEEDQKGLFAVGKLGNSTIGEDAFNDYKDGIIKEHSIGFSIYQRQNPIHRGQKYRGRRLSRGKRGKTLGGLGRYLWS